MYNIYTYIYIIYICNIYYIYIHIYTYTIAYRYTIYVHTYIIFTATEANLEQFLKFSAALQFYALASKPLQF